MVTAILLTFVILNSFIMRADELLPLGNFALPTALQPSPLFSFGQNIVDTHDQLGYISPFYYKGKKDKFYFFNDWYFLYGLSDSTSVFVLINVPVIHHENNLKKSGFGDTIIQGEYAFINKQTAYSSRQATLVASVYLPSGVMEPSRLGPGLAPHNPFTGTGSPSFFFGTTANYTNFDWYVFGSCGGLITTTHKESKVGNSIYYQAGVGHNLKYYNDKILLLLFEFDGTRTQKNKLMGIINPNSGGTTIYFGPSLYYATKHFIFQIGAQAPIYQRLNGIQPTISYLFSISFTWVFHHET